MEYSFKFFDTGFIENPCQKDTSVGIMYPFRTNGILYNVGINIEKEANMLFDLKVTQSGYNSTVYFEGTALTYEQCQAQILGIRSHLKETSGEEKRIKVEMTPTSFAK